VIKPVHKRAIDWAHEKGAVTMMHSCGNIIELLPDLVRTMSDPDAIEQEIRTKVAELKRNGGYIFHSDHSIPETVSFDDFRRVVELERSYGSYG
jgi:uroporphyrinogen decarboxylase